MANQHHARHLKFNMCTDQTNNGLRVTQNAVLSTYICRKVVPALSKKEIMGVLSELEGPCLL